jgi:hypothetical protein
MFFQGISLVALSDEGAQAAKHVAGMHRMYVQYIIDIVRLVGIRKVSGDSDRSSQKAVALHNTVPPLSKLYTHHYSDTRERAKPHDTSSCGMSKLPADEIKVLHTVTSHKMSGQPNSSVHFFCY